MSGRFAAGELADERLPGDDGLIELLLGHEAFTDLEEDCWNTAIERVLGNKVSPGGACLREVARLSESPAIKSCVSRMARWASALCGTVGKLGQIGLPGGDRRGEVLLTLENLADLERGRHDQLGPITASGLGLDLEAFFLEKLGKRLECLLALPRDRYESARE